MRTIVNLLFEAKMLKEIPRSGYHFLGAGEESVAEHSFMITFIAYAMAEMDPSVDALKLISMCLIHDLPEARTGDLNYVQKNYVSSNFAKGGRHTIKDLPFGSSIAGLIEEFRSGETRESLLAHDADQIAFILDLKALMDIGHSPPQKWLPTVLQRLKTETGKLLAQKIMETEWDEWWLKNYVDRPE